MKKFVSLLLALVLSLSVVGCGAEPVPDPGNTLDALLNTLFREDTTGMGQLFGYTSYDAVIEDWLDGEDPRALLTDAFVGGFAESASAEGVTIDNATTQDLADAVLDAIARAPFTCTTDTVDEAAGTAVVTVSINPFPEDCFGDTALDYVYANYLDELLAVSDDTAELYAVIFKALTQYIEQLQPVAEAKTFTVNCELAEDTINGKTRTCWIPSDAESFGEQFVYTMFDMN